jgi:hypothetical protein
MTLGVFAVEATAPRIKIFLTTVACRPQLPPAADTPHANPLINKGPNGRMTKLGRRFHVQMAAANRGFLG